MKRLLHHGLVAGLLLVANLLCSLPAVAGVAIQHWVSASGVRVYFVENHALPIVDVNIDFAAGSAYDPPGKSGLSALIMTMIDMGADDLDEATIARRFADIGAQMNGNPDTDRLGLSLRTLSTAENRLPALELLTKILRAPHFDAAILERERARGIASLKDSLTRPDTIVSRTFWSKTYPGHPYGTATTVESLNRIQRDDLVAFYKRYCTRNNAILTLVGDLTRAQAEQVAEQLFAALPAGEAIPPLAEPGLPDSGEHRIAHPASQAHIHIGLPALKRGDLDIFPLVVGNYTLGSGGFVSRLMHEVREKKGYVYGIYSAFNPLRQPGPFMISLQTRREQTSEALALTRQVFTRFMQEGPTDAELAAAKANLTGSFPLRLDSNKKLLDNVSLIAFYGLPLDWLDRYQERVRQVSREDVKRAFARHIQPERLVTVIVAGN